MENNAVIYALMCFALYFLPTFMARKGRKGSVFVLNLFVGWTVIGWGIALFMAVRSKEEKVA